MTEYKAKRIMDKTFTVLIDTREQDTKQLTQRIKAIRYPIERRKLNFGDYSAKVTLDDGSEFSLEHSVVIERKNGPAELCGNFTSKRARFAREFDRAKASGAKTYLLVENTDWNKITYGFYSSRMTPEALVGSITTWMARYNCVPIFCPDNITGIMVRVIMYHEMREALLKIDDEK